MDFSKFRKMALNTGLGLIKLDPMKDKLEKLNIKDDDDIEKIKELLKSIKDSKQDKKSEAEKGEDPKEEKDSIIKIRPRREGAIDMDIFMSVKDTVLCSEDQFNEKCCVNILMVERDGRTIDAVVRQKGKSNQKYPYNNNKYPNKNPNGFARQKVSKEQQEMQNKAEEYRK